MVNRPRVAVMGCFIQRIQSLLHHAPHDKYSLPNLAEMIAIVTAKASKSYMLRHRTRRAYTRLALKNVKHEIECNALPFVKLNYPTAPRR